MTLRVLVVDDEPSVRVVVRASLSGVGIAVVEASDGPSALDALSREEVDLVLLDLMMPELDGFDVLDRIRAEPEFAHIPVIILTAKTGEDPHVAAFRAGADGYLTKPFDVEALVSQVQDVAARGVEAREQVRIRELAKAEALRQIEAFGF
ncbi:MAG TPA: response regulator [Egibacteraceae bacterium]|nr:response regulator [Egibacteraceae bacterium]